jgi:Aspartyl/Asparaginyl beta-hydroxylase
VLPDGHYGHAFFSALAAHTHIVKHHGPTNKKLRVHLSLVAAPGTSRLRVGDQVCVFILQYSFIVYFTVFESKTVYWLASQTKQQRLLQRCSLPLRCALSCSVRQCLQHNRSISTLTAVFDRALLWCLYSLLSLQADH